MSTDKTKIDDGLSAFERAQIEIKRAELALHERATVAQEAAARSAAQTAAALAKQSAEIEDTRSKGQELNTAAIKASSKLWEGRAPGIVFRCEGKCPSPLGSHTVKFTLVTTRLGPDERCPDSGESLAGLHRVDNFDNSLFDASEIAGRWREHLMEMIRPQIEQLERNGERDEVARMLQKIESPQGIAGAHGVRHASFAYGLKEICNTVMPVRRAGKTRPHILEDLLAGGEIKVLEGPIEPGEAAAAAE